MYVIFKSCTTKHIYSPWFNTFQKWVVTNFGCGKFGAQVGLFLGVENSWKWNFTIKLPELLFQTPYSKNAVSKNKAHLLKQAIFFWTKHETQRTCLSVIFFDICSTPITWYIHIIAQILYWALLIGKSFAEKVKLKFPAISCSFKTDPILWCTHPQGWCLSDEDVGWRYRWLHLFVAGNLSVTKKKMWWM